jgi:transcriptional regulator with XRE-family HTH domain
MVLFLLVILVFGGFMDKNKIIECSNCDFDCSRPCFVPSLITMDYNEWATWCKAVKKRKNISNSKLAEMSDRSKGTVDTVLSGATDDPRLSTVQAITKAPVDDQWAKYPCRYAYLKEENLPDTRELEERLRRAEEALQNEEEKKKDAREKIDFLKDQISVKDRAAIEMEQTLRRRDKTIAVLAIAVAALAIGVIALFVADSMVTGYGWFR